MKKSCLNEELVKELVWDNYGIKASEARIVGFGVMSSRYKISSGNDVYFLKEFLSRTSREKIRQEAELLNFLKSESIPVAEFLKTNNDKYCVKHEDRYICMQEFIDGDCYERNDFSNEFMLLAAQMLGKIDASLKDYKLKDRPKMTIKDCKSYNPRRVIRGTESLLAKINELKITPKKLEKTNKEVQHLIKLQGKIKKHKKKFKNITYSSSHGDYRCTNLMMR